MLRMSNCGCFAAVLLICEPLMHMAAGHPCEWTALFSTGHLAVSKVAHECGLAVGRSLPMPALPPPSCQVNNMVLLRRKYEYLEGSSESSDYSKALRSTGQRAENIGKKTKTK